MRASGLVRSWQYEEQLFNEPYEQFFEILTSPKEKVKGGSGKGTRVMTGGMVSSVGERTAMIPLTKRPDQPFARETEKEELKKLDAANVKVQELLEEMQRDIKAKQAELDKVKNG
jgi:YEATS domain-containing protein 4